VRIAAVDLVQVDVVELQPLKARVHGAQDVSARQSRLVHARPHSSQHLGGENELVTGNAKIEQRLAGHDFRLAGVVHIRRVDEIDAAVERGSHDAVHIALLELSDLGKNAPPNGRMSWCPGTAPRRADRYCRALSCA